MLLFKNEFENKDSDWISINDKQNPIPKIGNIKIKFKNGYVCDYNQEEWPFEMVTHWRLKK
jgi:hypothetical protein